MKWYFVKIRDVDSVEMYGTKDSNFLTFSFPHALFVDTVADAIGIKNSMHKSIQQAAEIWSINTKSMKMAKVKL